MADSTPIYYRQARHREYVLPDMSHYKMFCPVCQEKGLKSTVRYNKSGASLAVARPDPYWDENGKFVSFEVPKVPDFICSNGHQFDDPEFWRTPVPL